jgi:Uma2 family endonuclease
MASATASPILEAATKDGMQFVGLTVKQYDWLIEQGKIPEDTSTELVEGLIVKKDRSAVGENPLSIGDRHRTAVLLLADLGPRFHGHSCFIQSLQPIWIPPKSEPEPDLCVATGTIADYRRSKPAVGQITSVIEVADSSLKRDLGTKLAMYARGKVPEYIVVNLVDNVVLVHHNPSRGKYPAPVVLHPGERLKIRAGSDRFVEIDVAKLM